MNVDRILQAFAAREAEAILIGGMNFLLRHRPILTYDVDLWVRDREENLQKVAEALHDLGAEWGPTETSWAPLPSGCAWLRGQPVFCLTTREGAVDIFREVRGLEGKFEECWARAERSHTAERTPFRSLADADITRLPAAPARGRTPWRTGRLPEGEIEPMTSEEKRREEEKRERMYDPVLRWRHIQETITFAEANMPPHLRRNVPRRPKWLAGDSPKT